jgi:hypothetical protein
VSAARELIAVSDALDAAEARARSGWASGYRAGADAARERSHSEGYAAAVADIKRTERELVAAVRGVGELLAARWHLCCPACRLAGHRAGCRDCQARTRETFAGPLPGEYAGGPVAWLPGWAPGSGRPPGAERAAA